MLPEYDQSWFTVVTETEMRSRPSRITEKMLAPPANFHPFIVFGNPGALAQFRDLGYLTFDGVIDETYDRIEEPERRFRAAYGEFLRLCRLDQNDLKRLEDRIRERLIFNAKWGMTQLPKVYAEQLDAVFLSTLLATA